MIREELEKLVAAWRAWATGGCCCDDRARECADELDALLPALREAVRDAEVLRAQVERDDLIYTDELAIQAARDVGLREVMHGVPPTQATALLRAYMSRVKILARRRKAGDFAAEGRA